MAKLSARGHREVARWATPEGELVLVLRSDGTVLRGHRRSYGGFDYVVHGKVKPNLDPVAAVDRYAARRGMSRVV